MTQPLNITALNITVLGSGAWGTAIAKHASQQSHSVTLWCRRQEVADAINTNKENLEYLKGIDLNGIDATSDVNCTSNANIVFVAVPSQYIRDVLSNIKVADNTPVVLCCKGVELGSLSLMNTVAKECLNNANVMVLSGPTFAIEVANNLPTAVTLAGINTDIVFKAMTSPMFRIYKTQDIIGAEIGGAAKNVMAIACGIAHGKQLGENAKASLITRACAEISRLSIAMGGKPETIMSLCGMGDLVLTCSSPQSRNMSFGIALGQNISVEKILASRNTITEGVQNAKSIYALAEKMSVEMPIVKAIYNIIHNNKDVEEAIKSLLQRPQKQDPEN